LPANDPEAQQRQRDADLIQQGRDRERVDSRLTQLERRADKVNGSQVRMANLQDKMLATLTEIKAGMQQETKSAQKTFTRWQTAGVLVAIVVGILGVIFLAIQTLHGLQPVPITLTTPR
jgi:hypothetical protein